MKQCSIHREILVYVSKLEVGDEFSVDQSLIADFDAYI